MFEFDSKASASFSSYDRAGGQEHDAGFDAYMTGLVFAALSKRKEIGDLLKISNYKV